MAQKKEHVQTHYLPTESYLATRAAALHFPAKQFADMINDQNSVYGMVIDMPIYPVHTGGIHQRCGKRLLQQRRLLHRCFPAVSDRGTGRTAAGGKRSENPRRMQSDYLFPAAHFPAPPPVSADQEGHFRKESPALCHQGRKRRHAGDLFPLSAGHAGTPFRTAERSGNVPEVNRNGGVSCDSIRKERTLYH